MLTDSIAALATPPGRSALAIVRLSGRGAFDIAARVIAGFLSGPPRTARLARFVDTAGETIDRGLYFCYPAPHSATGDDLVEFSCHGGLMAPIRLLEALHAAGARPAAPGEFSRRAVLNGKLDLLQAEAVGDLIDASAPAQAAAAVHQMEGGLSRRISDLRQDLVGLESLLAYDIDFPEEDDGPLSRDKIERRRAEVAERIDAMLRSAPAGERLREGALVVLTGAPNAGKSSLFNALLGSSRALVTEMAGTTRDAIEAHTDFLGWPVRLVDTAGINERPDRIEALGMEVAARYISAADLVIRCVETGKTEETGQTGERVPVSPVCPVLQARTKCDLESQAALGVSSDSDAGIPVSSVTGEGLDQLRRIAGERLFGARIPLADLEPALSRARHREALTRAQTELAEARQHLVPGGDAVLVAHHVRHATRALDELVGVVDIEEVLDKLFAGFCVGK